MSKTLRKDVFLHSNLLKINRKYFNAKNVTFMEFSHRFKTQKFGKMDLGMDIIDVLSVWTKWNT